VKAPFLSVKLIEIIVVTVIIVVVIAVVVAVVIITVVVIVIVIIAVVESAAAVYPVIAAAVIEAAVELVVIIAVIKIVIAVIVIVVVAVAEVVVVRACKCRTYDSLTYSHAACQLFLYARAREYQSEQSHEYRKENTARAVVVVIGIMILSGISGIVMHVQCSAYA
jgi:hypothetical protein